MYLPDRSFLARLPGTTASRGGAGGAGGALAQFASDGRGEDPAEAAIRSQHRRAVGLLVKAVGGRGQEVEPPSCISFLALVHYGGLWTRQDRPNAVR